MSGIFEIVKLIRCGILGFLTAVLAIASCVPASPVTITNRGEVIARPRVHFVLWGSYWHSPDGGRAADVLVRSYARISSVYFEGLAQYGVASPELAGMTTVTSYEPPSYITEAEIAYMLQVQMDSHTLRPSSESSRSVIYIVLLPPEARAKYRGFHFPFVALDGSTIWAAWVTYSSTMIADVLHELIESMTDPEGNGVQAPPVYPGLWREIADVCAATCTGSSVYDIPVPSYWSQSGGACVAPGATTHTRLWLPR